MFIYRVVAVVAIFFATTGIQAQRPLYDLPAPFELPVYTSSTMAVTRAGRIVTSNPLAERVSIINLQSDLDAEFDIGRNPRGVFIMPDNLHALAVAHNTLVRISLEDNAITNQYRIAGEGFGVVSNDQTAYVSLIDKHTVIGIDLESGRILQQIPTPPNPAALALWGEFLYVTHFTTGEFSLIYLPAGEVVRTIQPNPQAILSHSLEVDPINGRAFLPQSISNIEGTYDNRVIPVLYVIDLKTLLVEESINLVLADRAVNMPFAVVQPSNRSRLYIANAGSNDVTILNLDTRTADNHIDVGGNPRAIRFNNGFTRLYVQDAVDGTVSIFDTAFFGLQDQVPSHMRSIDPLFQIGARLFNSSTDPRLSANRLLSCASCHLTMVPDSDSIDAEQMSNHIEMMMGGTGLEADSLDMDALISYMNWLDS